MSLFAYQQSLDQRTDDIILFTELIPTGLNIRHFLTGKDFEGINALIKNKSKPDTICRPFFMTLQQKLCIHRRINGIKRPFLPLNQLSRQWHTRTFQMPYRRTVYQSIRYCRCRGNVFFCNEACFVTRSLIASTSDCALRSLKSVTKISVAPTSNRAKPNSSAHTTSTNHQNFAGRQITNSAFIASNKTGVIRIGKHKLCHLLVTRYCSHRLS